MLISRIVNLLNAVFNFIEIFSRLFQQTHTEPSDRFNETAEQEKLRFRFRRQNVECLFFNHCSAFSVLSVHSVTLW